MGGFMFFAMLVTLVLVQLPAVGLQCPNRQCPNMACPNQVEGALGHLGGGDEIGPTIPSTPEERRAIRAEVEYRRRYLVCQRAAARAAACKPYVAPSNNFGDILTYYWTPPHPSAPYTLPVYHY